MKGIKEYLLSNVNEGFKFGKNQMAKNIIYDLDWEEGESEEYWQEAVKKLDGLNDKYKYGWILFSEKSIGEIPKNQIPKYFKDQYGDVFDAVQEVVTGYETRTVISLDSGKLKIMNEFKNRQEFHYIYALTKIGNDLIRNYYADDKDIIYNFKDADTIKAIESIAFENDKPEKLIL